MFEAQQNFQKAVDAQEPKKQDSLFNLVLKGSEGKQGAVKILLINIQEQMQEI
jgi:hypothetical protein